mmetsp:Transcript_96122/g.222844  ORF Transcript_96122/g.222844 Transcript_96122/m.222844 type:complete len:281 (-) Transcript_96122:126-968(-)
MHCTLAALCALCGFTLASGLNSAQLADVLLKQDHLEHSRAVKAVHRGTFDLHTDSRNTPTTVTYEGFFSRLQESFGAFIGGVILIIFSFPVLWFNESRSARMESLASWGETQCRSVSGQTVDEENRDWLVHIQSAQASGVARMSDARFDVMFERGYLRLQSTVEVYQIVEHEKKEEKEKKEKKGEKSDKEEDKKSEKSDREADESRDDGDAESRSEPESTTAGAAISSKAASEAEQEEESKEEEDKKDGDNVEARAEGCSDAKVAAGDEGGDEKGAAKDT